MRCFASLRLGNAQVIVQMGNHILTLAVQAHNSKLKTNIKRDNKSVRSRNVISFCRYKGLGFAYNAFDRSNAMLVLLPKCKFSAKDITLSTGIFYLYNEKNI